MSDILLQAGTLRIGAGGIPTSTCVNEHLEYLGSRGLALGIALAPPRQCLLDHRAIHGHFFARTCPFATNIDTNHGVRQQAGRTLRLLCCGNSGSGSCDGRGSG